MSTKSGLCAVLFFAQLFATGWGEAAEFECPPPARQTGEDLKGELDGQAQTLLKIGTAQLKGQVDKTVVDLFSKYPNADKVTTLQNLLSTTCNMIRTSKQMSDTEKFDRWLAVFPLVRSYFPAQ